MAICLQIGKQLTGSQMHPPERGVFRTGIQISGVILWGRKA
jgi:hypothetical protein